MMNINIDKVRRSRIVKELDKDIEVELDKLDSLTNKRTC